MNEIKLDYSRQMNKMLFDKEVQYYFLKYYILLLLLLLLLLITNKDIMFTIRIIV